jgi:hypothetical protein
MFDLFYEAGTTRLETMKPEQPDTDLLVRVRKLLDKAERTANSHESDAFSRKAAELIARHRIDPARLAAIDRGGEFGVLEVVLGRGAYVQARLWLLVAVARVHDVRVVYEARPTGTVAIAAGFRSDLDVVEILYNSLHQQAASQMANIRMGSSAATQRFRRSFLFGFAIRLGEMLEEANTQAVDSSASPAGSERATATALAVQSRNDRIDEFAGKTFGKVRAARPPAKTQPSGFLAGQVAAGGVDLGRTRISGRRAIGAGNQ